MPEIPRIKRMSWEKARAKQAPGKFNYGKSRWTKASLRHRRANPLCVACKAEGKVTEAKVTDHIIPIEQGHDPWDESNWQSLCLRCHQVKRRKESGR